MINLSNAHHYTNRFYGSSDLAPKSSKKFSDCADSSDTKDLACLPVDRVAKKQIGSLKNHDMEDDREDKEEHCGDHKYEMPFLRAMIENLVNSDGEAYEDAAARLGDFYNYLTSVFDEQQLARAIEANGGAIVEQNSDFFVIRDSNNNQYVIERRKRQNTENNFFEFNLFSNRR